MTEYKAAEIDKLGNEDNATLAKALETAKAAIEAAETQEAIDAAVAVYKEAVDAKLTPAGDLTEAKATATTTVTEYKATEIEALKDAAKAELATALEAAKTAIGNAETQEAIDAAVAAYKEAVDAKLKSEEIPADPTVTVAVKPARVWAVDESNPDEGKAPQTALYDSYSVTSKESTEEGVDYDVTIAATNVVKHKAGNNTEAYWVGLALIPGEEDGVTGAALYVGESIEALAVDNDCTFGKALYEDTTNKTGTVADLIAEYFRCDPDKTEAYKGTFYVKVVWTLDSASNAEGGEAAQAGNTVEQIFKVTLDVTKKAESTTTPTVDENTSKDQEA